MKVLIGLTIITLLAIGVLAYAGPGYMSGGRMMGSGHGGHMMGSGHGGHMMGSGHGGHMMERITDNDQKFPHTDERYGGYGGKWKQIK